MEDRGRISRMLGSVVFGIVGAVADVAAVVVLITNRNFLNWVSDHIEPAVVVVGVLFLMLVTVSNAWQRLRGEKDEAIGSLEREKNQVIKRLEERNDELSRQLGDLLITPSRQDVARFKDFSEQFGIDSSLYRWLKEGFYLDRATGLQLEKLDTMVEKFRRDPTTFHDAEVAKAFDKLKSATFDFCEATQSNYFSDDKEFDGYRRENKWFKIPSEWEGGSQNHRWEKAIDTLKSTHRAVLDAYSDFVNVAHAKKMTE